MCAAAGCCNAQLDRKRNFVTVRIGIQHMWGVSLGLALVFFGMIT